MGRALPQIKGWFDNKTLKRHGWAPILAGMHRGTQGHFRTKLNLGRPSGGGETLGKLPQWVDFPPWGARCWGMGPPDIRHTMQGFLAHALHVGAMIPEAQVNVLFAGPAIMLVGP